jgi:predicted permease
MILQVSAQMFLVILVGWLARRRGYLSAESTAALGRLIIDVAFPALIFVQVLRTMDAALLRAEWYVPLLGAAFIVAGQLVGDVLARFFAEPRLRPTLIFVVALTNWVFLPLPIAQALYGDAGTQAVLLMNVGAQTLLWTLCVWRLARHSPEKPDVRQVLLNPGLIATVASLALVLAGAHVATSEQVVVKTLFAAGSMVATLTVPLSMLVTGSQLAHAAERGLRLTRPVVAAMTGRLVLTPLLLAVVLLLAQKFGAQMAPVPVHVACLIAGMPAAVSCGAFAERFGGDVELATRVVFFSTVVALVTLPALEAVLLAVGM